MNVKTMACAAAVVAVAIPGAAFAEATATAITDLNIRTGPGSEYPVIGVIQDNDQATIAGCIRGSLWCQVTYNGRQGWSYSKYLTTPLRGSRVVVAERREAIGIPTVTYETTGVAPAVAGATTGALVAGPVGAAVGGVTGAAVGAGAALAAAITPPPAVDTYVINHPLDEVYLDGEVVVGAGLPASVALAPIPDYRYRYVYVNRQPVLVEPSSRRIVYVDR